MVSFNYNLSWIVYIINEGNKVGWTLKRRNKMSRIGELVKLGDKFVIRFNGVKLVSSNSRQSCIDRLSLSKKAKKLGITEFVDKMAGNGVVEMEAGESISNMNHSNSKFEINKRFDFMNQLTNMVIKGETPSLIITGEAGVGKTYTVLNALKAAGLKPNLDYVIIKGMSTPKGMYRVLYENSGKLVIFDDCDSVLKDPVSLNILKGALDSYDTRVIHWLSERESDLPSSFVFDGRIIFISNYPKERMNPALISRSILVDVSMTTNEKIERIQKILPEIGPENASMEAKTDSLDLMIDLQKEAFDFNLRTFLRILKVRTSNNVNGSWRELAEYMVTQ